MGSLDSLPEECIAHVLSLTTPRDAARVSAVSRSFRSAADSDIVWSNFLPKDTDDIISSSSSSSSVPLQRKKDVYFQLCNTPVLVYDGSLSFSLDKESGKKCYMIAAKDFSIVWGDTPRYWRRNTFYRSRFSEVVELLRACWLEIQAKIEMRLLSSNTDYAAYFIFNFVEGNYGFDNQPVDASVFAGSEGETRNIFLDPGGKLRQHYKLGLEKLQEGYFAEIIRRNPRVLSGRKKQFPQEREDGWMEVELGEFMTNDSDAGEVKMNLMEVKSGKWKSGLIIQGIELRPKLRKTDGTRASLSPRISGRPR